jgi:iron complex transport system substrate-binding protein
MKFRALLTLALALALSAAHAYEVTDDTGAIARFDAPPVRIVSLLPSLTETVCALRACGRLVGLARSANWPAEGAKLRRPGGGIDVNVEAVAALRPDLVLISTASPAAVRLRALGLRVVQLEPRTQADMRRMVHTLAQVLQSDGAEPLLREIDVGVQAAARTLPPAARGLKVYFEVSPAPYAAGRDGFIGELMQALGLDNVAGPGAFPRINPEAVVRAAPQLIIASPASLADMPRRPGWAALAALREGRTCAFDAGERDILVRPGPRMAEAARLMAGCVARHTAALSAASPS